MQDETIKALKARQKMALQALRNRREALISQGKYNPKDEKEWPEKKEFLYISNLLIKKLSPE